MEHPKSMSTQLTQVHPGPGGDGSPCNFKSTATKACFRSDLSLCNDTLAAPDRAAVRGAVHGSRPPALLPLRAQAVPHPGRCSGLRGDRAGPQPHQE